MMVKRVIADVSVRCSALLRVVACTFALLAMTATAARAQDLDLQRVQNLINGGRFTEARTVLTQWQEQSATREVAAEDLALGLFLDGALTTDAKQAEDIYVAVVLSYPSSKVAPQALLRLGQGLLTAGEHQRAMAYLERLRSDYPGTPERETGLLWLARAQLANDAAAAACTTARSALDETRNPNVRSLLELERDRACGSSPSGASSRDTGLGAPPAADPVPAGTPPVRSATEPQPQRATDERPQPPQRTEPQQTQQPKPAQVRGDYAVQVGAFRERRSAEVIAAQMRDKGFDARIVQVDDSPLHRIRFGTYTTSAEAAVAGQRIRNAGFASIIVSDVRREIH